MALLESDEALNRAEELVKKSRADETEVTVTSIEDAFVRFADAGPTQSADRSRVDVAIRVRLGGAGGLREARADCAGLEPRALEATLERALSLAEVSPARGDLVEMGGAVTVGPTAPDDATRGHGCGQKAAWVGRALEACEEHRLNPAGLARTNCRTTALVNSRGRAVAGSTSRASFSLTAFDGAGAGIGEDLAQTPAALDVEAAIARAVDKGAGSRAPERVEPGEYTVVLEPLAVSSILLFAAYHGFGARELAEESSFLCDRLGKRVFAESVALHDDAGNGTLPGLGFDGEGTPKQRVELVRGGTPLGVVTDRFWARKRGEDSTGHAKPQPSGEGPGAENLVLTPGGESLDQLVAGVEDGLLVTQFHYTNVIDPRELLLTGMTRNGTFRIRGGEVVGAVRNLRFTESLVGALSRVTGVGSEQRAAGALFGGDALLPALRVDGFRFTSSADF